MTKELTSYLNRNYGKEIKRISFDENIVTITLNTVSVSRGQHIVGLTEQELEEQTAHNAKTAKKMITDLMSTFEFEDAWNSGEQNEIVGGVF